MNHGQHTTQIVPSRGIPSQYRAFCTCLMTSGWVEFRWQAEDWIRIHDELVQRARVHLRDRNPSLKDQWNWYNKQAQRMDIPIEERTLWTQLANELFPRLGQDAADQETLPFDVEPKTQQRRFTP